jgi:translation initiation factor IF-1
MVKNVKGGSKSKRFARKNMAPKAPERTRLANPKEPCEMYAIVTKVFGQGMCLVRCNDGITRNCVIRKKFTGRNRHSNKIFNDVKVLVGIRDWEIVNPGKIPKCDLLEVYESKDDKYIKNDPRAVWKNLMSDSELMSCGNEVESAIIFDYSKDDEESENEEFDNEKDSDEDSNICLDDI